MSVDVTALCFQWTTARKRLSQAIDAFEIACSALAALGIRTGAILESAQPDFLLSVENDLSLLTREVERVSRFVEPMKRLRNESVVLVPINNLPSELLVSIFTIAVHVGRPRRWHSMDFVNVISSVSSYWRYVSLGTPALWTDIAFAQGGGLKHAALWLERSRSCPLTLYSLDNARSLGTGYPGYERDLDDLARRHSSRFKSLVFTTREDEPVGLKIFHAACAQYTEASVRLESLAIHGYLYPALGSVGTMGWPPKNEMDRYLKSVRFLYVKRRLFDDWTSTVFHDLTTLSLKWIEGRAAPSCKEFLDTLRASPRLSTLQIAGPLVNIGPNVDENPVTLNWLELLWLDTVTPDFVVWLLNAVVLPADGSTLVLACVSDHDRRVPFALNFPFSILNGVKILYLRGEYHGTCTLDLPELVRALPRLETLALKNVVLDSKDSDISRINGHGSMLATLDLVSCGIGNAQGFISMLSHSSIRQLRIFKCIDGSDMDELLEGLPELTISEEPGDFLQIYSPFP